MKIVLNRKYGKFLLSNQALKMLAELKGIPLNKFDIFRVRRTDKFLVQVAIELGEETSLIHGRIKVHTIPNGIIWTLKETDGIEWVEWPTFGGGTKKSYLIPGND